MQEPLRVRIQRLSEYKASEVARILGIHERTVQQHRRRDRIHGPAADVPLYFNRPSRSGQAYERQRLARLEVADQQKPSLPRVSILEKDLDVTPADYHAGKAGQAAAGY